MTNHQLYMDWITSDDTLPTDCARELREHMRQCARCRTVSEGWASARQTIQAAGMEPAPAGFVRRWKVLSDKRLREANPRQAWAFLTATGLASLALGAGLAAQTASMGFSMTNALTRSVTFAAGAVADWNETAAVLGTIVQAVTHATPPVIWLAIISLLCALCAGWTVFLYRFTRQGAMR